MDSNPVRAPIVCPWTNYFPETSWLVCLKQQKRHSLTQGNYENYIKTISYKMLNMVPDAQQVINM